MNTYKVWHDGNDEMSGEEIEARSPRDAAEKYAEEEWRDSGCGDDAFDVLVRDGETVRSFTVDIEVEPSFYTTENKTP